MRCYNSWNRVQRSALPKVLISTVWLHHLHHMTKPDGPSNLETFPISLFFFPNLVFQTRFGDFPPPVYLLDIVLAYGCWSCLFTYHKPWSWISQWITCTPAHPGHFCLLYEHGLNNKSPPIPSSSSPTYFISPTPGLSCFLQTLFGFVWLPCVQYMLNCIMKIWYSMIAIKLSKPTITMDVHRINFWE